MFRVIDVVSGRIRQRLEAPCELTQVQFRELLKLGLGEMDSMDRSGAERRNEL